VPRKSPLRDYRLIEPFDRGPISEAFYTVDVKIFKGLYICRRSLTRGPISVFLKPITR
jgi:hypothetical protein